MRQPAPSGSDCNPCGPMRAVLITTYETWASRNVPTTHSQDVRP